MTRTANLRDPAERYAAAEVEQDYLIGPFRYRWSIGDEPMFHFERACLDLPDLLRAADHRMRSQMPARTDIEPTTDTRTR